MSIPEDMIIDSLNTLLSHSEPGDDMQYLHIISAPADAAFGPLGVADESQLEEVICGIVPDTPTPLQAPDHIRKAIAAMAAQQEADGKTVMFAAASHEVGAVDSLTNHDDDLAKQLQREGRLHKHPNAAELTIVYAACRDGRRWRGSRYLTGPRASETIEPNMIVGPIRTRETSGIIAAGGILRMVGLA